MAGITGTKVAYYHICLRKLWLFDRDVQMEHTSEVVEDGSLLHLSAYPQRAERYRELQFEGIKIDFYDPKDKLVHEIKRSNKMHAASVAQVKYYLYILERHGIPGVTGLLEYPTQRQTEEVFLTDADRAEILQWEAAIEKLTADDAPCPPVINKPFCRQCAYYDFCYVQE